MPVIKKAKAVFLDVLERAAVTGGEQFMAVCVATGGIISLTGLPCATALTTAAGAFIVAFLTGIAAAMVHLSALPYWWEVARRVTLTFIQSLLAAMGANVINVATFHWVSALNVAALTTFLSLVKCLVSPNALHHVSPSLLHASYITALKGSTS